MNAKETLKKIADALTITSTTPEKQETAPIVEAVEPVEAPVVEAPVVNEKAEESVEVVDTKTEDVPAVEPVAEAPVLDENEPLEKEVVEDVSENKVDNDRVKDLESQIEDLKKILENALSEPKEDKLPEQPKAEEGLTHSPEKQVAKKAAGIGKKGDDVMSRVFKYINNN